MNEYFCCAHCGVEFLGTFKQIKNHKHDVKYGLTPRHYCSNICRYAARIGGRPRTSVGYKGTCGNCGKEFTSRYKKDNCSQKCYVATPAFKERMRSMAKNALLASLASRGKDETHLNHIEIECLSCKTKFFEKKSKKSKFCSKICYRTYMNERFDRWVASPQSISLPQNYDEFLLQAELPCLVEGCDWHGKNLSGHMNFAHGVTAEEFKRAAGFNQGTGLVTADVSQKMSERPHMGLVGNWLKPKKKGEVAFPKTKNYFSLEGKEHAAKSRALACETADKKKKTCRNCNKEFLQSTPFGRTLYCSHECRQTFLRTKFNAPVYSLVCSHCKKEFLGGRMKQLRFQRGQKVTCSLICRNHMNIERCLEKEGKSAPYFTR